LRRCHGANYSGAIISGSRIRFVSRWESAARRKYRTAVFSPGRVFLETHPDANGESERETSAVSWQAQFIWNTVSSLLADASLMTCSASFPSAHARAEA